MCCCRAPTPLAQYDIDNPQGIVGRDLPAARHVSWSPRARRRGPAIAAILVVLTVLTAAAAVAARHTDRRSRPDVVLLNEVRRWEDDHRQLARAVTDLDLDVVPLPPPKIGHRSAIPYRRQITDRRRRYSCDLG